MEEYIEEALHQGFIHPSTSLLLLAYHVLNSKTIKYRYPLPLIPAALEQLRGARSFTKLDLCSAYYLICIRKGDK